MIRPIDLTRSEDIHLTERAFDAARGKDTETTHARCALCGVPWDRPAGRTHKPAAVVEDEQGGTPHLCCAPCAKEPRQEFRTK